MEVKESEVDGNEGANTTERQSVEMHSMQNTSPQHEPTVQYAHTSGAPVQQTQNQFIVEEMPHTPFLKGDDRPILQPSIECIIFKRVLSILFFVLDLALSLSQFIAWVAEAELPMWMSFFEFSSNDKGDLVAYAPCDSVTVPLMIVYGVIVVIATCWCIVRVLNTVGETILEYRKQTSGETETTSGENESNCRGFQIIHGWVETVLAIILDDIPQVLLFVIFSIHCMTSSISILKILIWILIKEVKNRVRLGTCKQIYRPCCDGMCSDCCCVFRFDFICCCKIFFVRPFGWCCSKPVFELRSYDIRSDFTCTRGGRCWGEIEKDPEWATDTYTILETFFLIFGFSFVIIAVLKNFFNWLSRL